MANNTYMAVYTTLEDTKAALTLLETSGFDMGRLSVAGAANGASKHTVGCYDTGEGLKYSGKSGVLWRQIAAPLTGSGAFWSLEGGLLLVMGPLVKAIVAGQETSSSVPGTSDFGAGLWGIGIPPDSIAQYEVALRNKQFLLFVDGAVDDIERAHYALTDTRLLNGTLHHGTLDYGSN
jgi:hypothetical protein